MKRLLAVICLVVLILTVTSGALAEGTVRLDFVPGGSDILGSEDDFCDSKQTGKLSSYFVSYEGIFKDFKFGIDYGNGTDKFKAGDIIKSDQRYDFNMFDYRFGARLLDYERVKLDVMFSKLQVQLKNSDNENNMDGYLLGCDVFVPISEKISFDGYLGYSFFGATYEENGTDYDTAYLLALKAKINYAVSERVAFSLGLRDILCAVDDYNSGTMEELGRSIGGYSIGVKYSF